MQVTPRSVEASVITISLTLTRARGAGNLRIDTTLRARARVEIIDEFAANGMRAGAQGGVYSDSVITTLWGTKPDNFLVVDDL
jgi:hypothetical protein